MNEKEIMSEEAFKELIDNLEIVEKTTPYGKKAIKYWVIKLQKENEDLKEIKNIANTKITDLRKIKDYDKLQGKIWILQTKLKEKDKIIDLMAEYIEKITVDMKIAFGENMLWDRNEIKQYFEQKATNSG